MKATKIQKLHNKVDRVRTLAKNQAKELALYTNLSLKSLRYLTTINLIDWYCDSIFVEGFSRASFSELISNVRKIASSTAVLACEDYFAT